MEDLFNKKILCDECERVMKPSLISKNGFNLRVLKCDKCNEIIVHPTDEKEYEEFIRLKNKEYEMKMRRVGNSYTVSIPMEIVSFMQDQDSMIDNMVRMCFQEPGKISMKFNTPEMKESRRVVSSKEVKIIKNGKVFHTREFEDSENPKKNRKIIFRNDMEEKKNESI